MPKIGDLNGALTFPAWSSPSYAELVPQWPNPNGPRVDGRLRWLSDPLFRPICGRYIICQRWAKATGLPDQYYQWYWADIEHVSNLRFRLSSGSTSYGNSTEMEIEYFDELPHSGLPGVRQDWTYNVAGDAAAFRSYEWTNAGSGYPYDTDASGPFWDWADPADHGNVYSGTYPKKDAFVICLADCYPANQLTAPNNLPMFSNGALIIPSSGGQSLNSSVEIDWGTTIYDTLDFFDPTTSTTEFVIPAGIDWARLQAQVDITNQGQPAFIWIRKNGGDFAGSPITRLSSGSATDGTVQCSSPWVPVEEGDVFDVRCQRASSSVTSSLTRTWFSIEV